MQKARHLCDGLDRGGNVHEQLPGPCFVAIAACGVKEGTGKAHRV